MLAAIVRKEFLGHVLGLRFVVGAAFCVALFTTSAVVLRSDHEDRVTAYQAAAARHREAARGAKTFSRLELELDRPPAALSLFCRGEDRALPTSSRFSLITAPTVTGSGASRNPLLVALPGLDLTIVVQLVMSLLALLFAYDAVCGERESGTLALVLSNQVPRQRLLLGKYLGGMAVLLPLLAVGFGLGLLVFGASPLIHFTSRDWGALALVFGLSAAYLSMVFLLGLVISIRSRRSGTSLVAALFVWVVAALLLPELGSSLAASFRPLPSQRERTLAEARLSREVQRRVRDYGRSHPWPLTTPRQHRFNVQRSSFYSGDIPVLELLYSAPREYVEWALEGTRFGVSLLVEAAEKTQQLRWQEVLARSGQADLAHTLRLVSPASAYYDAVASLADTGPARYRRFLQQAMAARTAFVDFARERDGLGYRFFTREQALTMPTYAELDALEQAGEKERLGRILGQGFADEPALDLSGLPVFTPPEAGLGQRILSARPGLTLLLLTNLVLVFVASTSFARADVRSA